MVLSRKKRKLIEQEGVAALASPVAAESAKNEAQTKHVDDGLQKKKEKKRKRDKVVDADTPVVQTPGGVVIDENAEKKKKKKEEKRRRKAASEVAAAGDDDRLSNGKINGAVDHSGAEAEPTPGDAERGSYGENEAAEDGSQVNGDQETENGDHKSMTVREKKGKKKKKDRWGGAVQEEEKEKEESADAAANDGVEHKSQTSGRETDESGDEYNPKKVYVGGMPYYITEDEIVDYFSECGKITELDCVLFPDTGKFRGLAFITFQTEQAARKALEWDGCEMGGRFLKITKCKVRPPKGNKNSELGEVQKHQGCLSVYIGNLSWDITEDVITNFLKTKFKQTKIEAIRLAYDQVTGEFRGFGHIDFEDDDSLEGAVSLNQTPLLGRPVKIAYSVPKRSPTQSSGSGGQGGANVCYSCGKEGHKAYFCEVKGGIIPARDGKTKKR